ncbi:rho GTPase [Colletotrichum asianum]|uniref:Rho GTPase n=1 Tax=Colletotrichum asianum TaxID=702518 RepID=A0A8H3WS07_9PEZI|nr:rho GTPase [Colletotrichum asianum]
MSYTTSTAPTNAWSMLSGISLNDVSVVSAYRLPITLNHIHLVAPGSIFSAMLMESHPAPPEGKLKTATAQNLSYLKSAVGWNRQASTRSLTSTSTETPKLTRAKTVSTPQTNVAERMANVKSSIDFPKMKSVYYREPRVGPCSLSCRVVVVGDSDALKSKMIHTFMSNAPVAADEDIPQGSDCSRSAVKVDDIHVDLELHDTTGVEDYSFLLHMGCSEADAFLVLSWKYCDSQFKSVKERWVPEISSTFHGVPYLVVRTHEGRNENVKDETLAKFTASSALGRKLAEASTAVRYVDCDVGDALAVRTLIGRIIVAANKVKLSAISKSRSRD